MPLWGNTANSANAPKWTSVASVNALGSNLYNNSTVAAFVNNMSVGAFGANVALTHTHEFAHQGWELVSHGTGPVLTVTVGNGVFINGETFKVTGGTKTATGTLTTNATGNLVSGTVVDGGAGFANIAGCTFAFNREKHLNDLKETGGVATGYSNTDYIVIANSAAQINARCTITTNATGGFGNSGIAIANVGLFANVTANNQVVVTVYAANGAASNGSGAVFSANLAPSTGGYGNVATLGGRAGRVQHETLVALHMTGDGSATIPTK